MRKKRSQNSKERSHGSTHTHQKTDNDNVLCQQVARRQDHAGLYVVHTYMCSKGVHTCTSWEEDTKHFVAQGDAQTPRLAFYSRKVRIDQACIAYEVGNRTLQKSLSDNFVATVLRSCGTVMLLLPSSIFLWTTAT